MYIKVELQQQHSQCCSSRLKRGGAWVLLQRAYAQLGEGFGGLQGNEQKHTAAMSLRWAAWQD